MKYLEIEAVMPVCLKKNKTNQIKFNKYNIRQDNYPNQKNILLTSGIFPASVSSVSDGLLSSSPEIKKESVF